MPSAAPTLITTPAGAVLDHLTIGTPTAAQPDAGGSSPRVLNSRWRMPSGLYTPQQVVAACAPLLETVLHHLGADPADGSPPARQLLHDTLAAILSTDTRESSLVLSGGSTQQDAGKREMGAQARAIGAAIVGWARELSEDEQQRAKVQMDAALDIRSPCEGHLLLPAAAQLMFGPRSKRHLMQLYNEYLHQLVLLRDALLPFANFAAVLIRIDADAALGLRFAEPARERFLTVLLTKSLTQQAVVAFARAVMTAGDGGGGVSQTAAASPGYYGFQLRHGAALPAFLAGSPALRLLHFFPARIARLREEEAGEEAVFVCAHADYFAAPRVEASRSGDSAGSSWRDAVAAAASATPRVTEARLEASAPAAGGGAILLNLVLTFDDGRSAAVDVGQIARGRRYAYRAGDQGVDKTAATAAVAVTVDTFSSGGPVAVIHSAVDLLTQQPADALVTAQGGGVHLVPAADQLVGLALLGRIYPENTVLLARAQNAGEAEAVGKSFAEEAKFVLVGEEWGVVPWRGEGGQA